MTQRFATLPAPAFNAAIVCDHALRAFKSILGRYAWWQQVLFSALGASLLMLAAGWVGAVLLTTYSGWGEGVVVDKASAVTTPGVFVRYDAWYYLQIARDGYRADGNERAFFPLYPLAVRGLSQLANISLLWSGFLFSLSCFVGSALLLYRWTEAEYGARVARLATLIFCLFPMSFFHMAFYAEPLLLLTTAFIAFVYIRRGNGLRSIVADTLLVAVVGWLLAWILIAVPAMERSASPDWLVITRSTNRALAVPVLFLIVLAFYSGVRRTPAILGVVGGAGIAMLADLASGAVDAGYITTVNAPPDSLYVCGVLIAAAGFVHPTIGRLAEPVPWHRTHSPLTRILMTVA